MEGSVDLWPFLTIVGDGGQNEIFHVCPGGELRLVSISLDAGEDGIAIVQEEGSFLIYASEEGMGLPVFSCIGQIISPQTVTAATEVWKSEATVPEKSTQQSQPETGGYSGNDEKILEALEEPISSYLASRSEEDEPQTDMPILSDSKQVDSDSEFVRSEWQIAIGISIIIAILAVSVGTSIYLRRNRNQ